MIFRAGFALNTVGSFVKGLMPLRAFVAGFLITMPIPVKPPVCNGMIAPRDSWMMPPPCNEMIPPGAPRLLA